MHFAQMHGYCVRFGTSKRGNRRFDYNEALKVALPFQSGSRFCCSHSKQAARDLVMNLTLPLRSCTSQAVDLNASHRLYTRILKCAARSLITPPLRSKAARFTRARRLLPEFNAFWAHPIAVNGEPCDPGRLLPNGPMPVKPSRALQASAPTMHSVVVRSAENKQGTRGEADDYEWDCHWSV
jgi:hypothetical protein